MFVSKISTPVANEKLTKKLLKLVKKVTKDGKIRKGVKETVKAVRAREGKFEDFNIVRNSNNRR